MFNFTSFIITSRLLKNRDIIIGNGEKSTAVVKCKQKLYDIRLMNILAIETSCDETSAAVIEDGKEIKSNIVASQIEFHKKYGGIVPEVASRKHIEVIAPVVKEALEKARTNFKKIDAVAVTYGPGLVGSLLVGICYAKSVAYALQKPLIGVNHIEGHMYANFLAPDPKHLAPKFPFICLIVSGGHTHIVLVKDHGQYETLGRTRDDAAGEAFDKVARFLGLGFPGGPIIDKMAKKGNPKAINFPRAMMDPEYGYDFSFSGIKTAVVYHVRKSPVPSPQSLRDLAASFQDAVVDMLVIKTIKAAKDKNIKTIALAGGVSANSELRKRLKDEAKREGFEIHIPPINLCTDNAAMIGCAGYYNLMKGKKSDLNLTATARLKI
jgi:N6-L-threonylcarbamoyladenine synthase